MPVAGLPPHLDGFTIGVMTDLHIGPLVSAGFIRRAAAELADRGPDLVVVAGDFCSTRKAAHLLVEALEPVGRPFAVLGNWDYKREEVRRTAAVRFLVNQGAEVAPGLWLAGVDDVNFGRPDLEAALAGAPPGAVRILLAHEPDFADRVEARHRIALQISGHSHGGQIRLPFLGAALLPPGGQKYVSGLNHAPHCPVYTSRGLGVAHLPVRIMCPPELTLIQLKCL